MSFEEKWIRIFLIGLIVINLILPIDNWTDGYVSILFAAVYGLLFNFFPLIFTSIHQGLDYFFLSLTFLWTGILLIISNIYFLLKKNTKVVWLNLGIIALFIISIIPKFSDFKYSPADHELFTYAFLILLAGIIEIVFLVRDRKQIVNNSFIVEFFRGNKPMPIVEKRIRRILIGLLLFSLILPGFQYDFGSDSVFGYISKSLQHLVVDCAGCSIGEMLLLLMVAVSSLAGFLIALSNVFLTIKKMTKLQWINILLVVLFIFWFLWFLYIQYFDDFKIAGAGPKFGIWVYSFLVLIAGIAEVFFLIRGQKLITSPEPH